MQTSSTKRTIEEHLRTLHVLWESYVQDGRLEQFIDFTVSVNSLTERFNSLRTSGMVRLCESLENAAFDKLGDATSHPLAPKEIQQLQSQIDHLLAAATGLFQPVQENRIKQESEQNEAWFKPRSVWLISADEKSEMAAALSDQLGFFGFRTIINSGNSEQLPEDSPLAVLFMPSDDTATAEELSAIRAIREEHPTTQLIYLGKQTEIEPIVTLMRNGIDVTIPIENQASLVLSYILDLVQYNEQEKSRVLIVEDSRVAVAVIERTLSEHGIDTFAIQDPRNLLETLESYHPDLILMDMYMPSFNGVEATRVLRQMPAYNTIPIVYLSGESEVAMQVEALRLGGDQFLIKPVNPILLAAVVKTKIERFRETLRSSRLDGLTGLLNHTAAKSRLKTMVSQINVHHTLTVAMLDIDRFKSINDTYGHPVGDQVIRSLAWLLKGHLRSNDLIGRYGGEEFLIALPGVSPEQARAVIDRIRIDFSTLPHAHANGSLNATFSAGIASYSVHDTAESLTESADNALLLAKRNGRNRIEKGGH